MTDRKLTAYDELRALMREYIPVEHWCKFEKLLDQADTESKLDMAMFATKEGYIGWGGDFQKH